MWLCSFVTELVRDCALLCDGALMWWRSYESYQIALLCALLRDCPLMWWRSCIGDLMWWCGYMSGNIRSLDVTLDKSLSFNSYISNVSKSYFYHTGHVHPAVSEDVARTIACSLVGCRLDYSNSILLDVAATAKNTELFCLSCNRQHSRVNISNTPKDLHWLPVSWRIDYKVATLTYKVFETGQLAKNTENQYLTFR